MIESQTTGLAKAEVIIISDQGIGAADVEMVPAEQELVFSINGEVEAHFCCTPHRVKSLVAGWLVGEGIILRPEEFIALETDLHTLRVDVTVSDTCIERLRKRSRDGLSPVLGETRFPRRTDTALELPPGEVDRLAAEFRKLFLSLRCTDRMCYLCSVATEQEIVTYGEGFHRLNALYRALGDLIIDGRGTEGKILLVNFGLSRLQVARIARAGISLAICMAPPSSSAIDLANDYYLSIICANMGDGLRVYSAPWRVI